MDDRRGQMSDSWKGAIVIAGAALALLGLPLILLYGALTLTQILEGGVETEAGIGGLLLLALTLGCGGAVLWHGSRAQRRQPSGPMRLPPAWVLAGVFGLFVVIGLASGSSFGAVVCLPPSFLVAAALPPLWAVSWFIQQETEGLTWRRGVTAFAAGATVSVFLALILEILFPTILLALVLDLARFARGGVESVLEALAGTDIAAAVTDPGFLFVLIQIAVIAPLAEELAKPLATLPLVGRLTRRDAFWVGAMAGAGFAALENAVYAGLGLRFWAGILVVRALGSAIHPLGTGLMALAWRDILQGEKDAWRSAAVRAAMAVGMHALWNGGSLLVIILAGARFFGELPPEIDVLGLSAAGTTLAMLIVLGLSALWIGRTIGQRLAQPAAREAGPVDAAYVLSARAVAVWALACLAAIVPAGIAGLQILLR
jgi:RsiW-degrading membrane proteinase PrsW (M82 family)